MTSTSRRPSNVSAVSVDIKVTDRHHNDHTETIEMVDYETTEMFMRRVQAALERALEEVS